jgi:hypothetical protein
MRSEPADASHELRVRFARRALELDETNLEYAVGLAHRLTAIGGIEEIRRRQPDLVGDDEATRRARELVAAELDVGEARFDRGYARLRKLGLSRPFGPVLLADRYVFIAMYRVAQILDRRRALADEWVTRFVTGAEPDRAGLEGYSYAFAVMCIYASPAISRACFDRIDRVAAQVNIKTGWGDADLLAGGRLYARGDVKGAVGAWRSLFTNSVGREYTYLPTAAFEAAGEHDLAERAEEPLFLERCCGGLSSIEPRLAVRALERGDHARAREAAERVIDRWGKADAPVPAVAEMRALLAKLPPTR